jgi:hypothetical protein
LQDPLELLSPVKPRRERFLVQIRAQAAFLQSFGKLPDDRLVLMVVAEEDVEVEVLGRQGWGSSADPPVGISPTGSLSGATGGTGQVPPPPLLRRRPGAQKTPQQHQLAKVVGVVVGHQEGFAEDGLAVAPGEAAVEIGGGVCHRGPASP